MKEIIVAHPKLKDVNGWIAAGMGRIWG